MKKSEIYKAAQVAVFKDGAIEISDALEILYELMEKERIELFKESEAGNNGNC